VRQKRRRLSRSAEFDRVYRHGQSAANRYLVLYAFPRDTDDRSTDSGDGDPYGRLGVSVGRRVGGAVVRNRVKRLLREAFWTLADQGIEQRDYVIVARPDTSELAERDGVDGFKRELRPLMQELTARLSARAEGERAAG
jgi:ribonuclease P protein component